MSRPDLHPLRCGITTRPEEIEKTSPTPTQEAPAPCGGERKEALNEQGSGRDPDRLTDGSRKWPREKDKLDMGPCEMRVSVVV